MDARININRQAMSETDSDLSIPGPVRPFLKWAGSKYRVLEHIHSILPQGRRLIEPFAGSAALFLNSQFDEYLLSDSNPDLINLYNILKDEGEDFIRYCKRYFTAANNQETRYYQLRDRFNSSKNIRQKAALFIYLNRHGYNGLCRYNAKGGYNVPFGRYKRPYFPAEEMRHFHLRAQRAEFLHCSFEQTFELANPGDVIYCDPPYVPLSASANFTSYASGGFAMEQQQVLAELAKQTSARGIPVLLSNHNTAFTRKAYKDARLKKFRVRRYISCNGSKRENAGELLALFSV